MDVALSIKDLGILLIGFGLIVLIFYLINVFRNFVITVKSLNVILKDAEEITAITAKRAKDIDGLMDDVTEVTGTFADNLRGNQSTIKAVSSIINTILSIKNLIFKSQDEDEKQNKNSK